MTATTKEDLQKRLDEGRLGLAMSFYKNQKPAINTAMDFADKLGATRSSVPLLLELDLGAADSFDDGVSLKDVVQSFAEQGWKEVWIWTRDATKIARRGWPSGLVNPIDEGFSYGGIGVRTQALGRFAGCDYVARTDPGCTAPKDLLAAILRHIDPIEQGYADFVCGIYEGRYAIRTDFLPQEPTEMHRELRHEFFRLVEAFTNVVPEAMVTAGALCACRTQGPPPPPFDAVRIVVSDDGFMKTVLGDRAVVDANTVVPRSRPGFGLSSHDYRVRLSLMAALDRLWRGKPTVSAAAAAVAFYRAIGALVADVHRADVNVAAAKIAVENQIDLIARGIERYHALLLGRWIDCLEVMATHADLVRVTKAT